MEERLSQDSDHSLTVLREERLQPPAAQSASALLQRLSLAAIMLLWGIHLGFPLNLTQSLALRAAGRVVPAYYFLVILPVLGAAVSAFSLKRRWTKWELLWCALPLTCLPGIIASDDQLWSIRQWLSWLFRGPLPGLVILAYGRKGTLARSMLLRWIYPIVIGAALLGIVEVYANFNPLCDRLIQAAAQMPRQDAVLYRPYYLCPTTPDRPRGTQGNRIPYSATLVAFLPLAAWLLKHDRRRRWAHFMALNVLLGAILIGQARSVWLGAAIGIVLMFAWGLQGWRTTAQIVAGLAAWLALFLARRATYMLFWFRYKTFHMKFVNIRSRYDVLQTASALKDRWLTGVGFGQFPTACRPYYHSSMPWLGTPDNQYLRWATENGLISFGVMAVVLAALIRASLRQTKHMDAREADFFKSLLTGWVSLSISFVFFDGFYWGACDMTFWCLLGLFATSVQA